MKTNLTISIIALIMSAIFCDADAQSRNSDSERGYYGLLDISGGYIHKWMPGSVQSPYDFMLGASYVNGYRFSPHFAMGLGAGLNYYFDNEQITAPIYLHLNADILKRTVTPYVALNLGYNIQINGGKYNYPFKAALTPEQQQEEIIKTDGRYGSGSYHYRGFFAEPSVGVRFDCGSKRANLGISYAFDGEIDRTTDAYRMRYFPQVRIKFGVEF
ncbi:MAG: hypothetical protein IJZ98_01270 [Bacteroidales bacterium]|nr:hypothetical protein [Bacteroidales bacterium]